MHKHEKLTLLYNMILPNKTTVYRGFLEKKKIMTIVYVSKNNLVTLLI